MSRSRADRRHARAFEAINTTCRAVDFARLTLALESAPPHLRPVFAAVRDRGIGFGVARHTAGAFSFPGIVPNLVLFDDIAPGANGPDSFDRGSLRRLVRTCAQAVVVSLAHDVELYAGAADAVAKLCRPVVLIETTPEREPLWLARLARISPRLDVAVNGPGVGESLH